VPEEPKDEYAKLKAKLDRVVYASDKVTADVPAKETVKPETQAKDVAKQEPAKDDAKPAAKAKDKETSKFYTVKKGDTAFSIAKKNNITMRELMEWNKLDFKTVKTGQKLQVKP